MGGGCTISRYPKTGDDCIVKFGTNECTFYGNGKYININQQSNKVESVTDFTPRQLETLNKLVTQS